MYELIILSLLMRGPMHGYLIAKIINDIIGPFAKVSNGRLYPLLAKLQEDGFIAAEAGGESQQGDRRQHPFAITDTGRQRLHQLMMDTTSNPGDYQRLFWMKLPCLHFLQATERLYLLDHYLNYCQTHIFHLTSEMEDLMRRVECEHFMTDEQLEADLFIMRRGVKQWQLDAELAREWRAREVARAEGLDEVPAPRLNARPNAGAASAAEKKFTTRARGS